MIENFHFIRPLWFYALFGLAFALYLLTKHRVNQSPWQQFLPEHLAKALLNDNENKQANKKTTSTAIFLLKPFIIGLLAIVTLAGPTWEKLPQPVYQVEKGSVLIMDMSYSMYATDIKPNRLTRARFKAIDLLDNLNEGDIGLVAYAGDAFVISPLTQDINNIELLLPSLTPDIMPELGSNPLAALTIAHEMLTNAGHLQGNIYWFTDGIDSEDIEDITAWSTKYGHKLNILGIGTESGAPITLPSGKLLKDNSGSIVVPKLPISYLKTVTKYGHGIYQSISNNNKDIEALTFEAKNSTEQDQNSPEQSRNNDLNQKNDADENQSFGDQWQELGPWLLLIILPLVLNYFRRGALLAIMPLAFLLFPTPSTFAQEDISTQAEKSVEAPFYKSAWQSLWKTDNQVAQEKFNQQNYQEAAKKFNNKNWQGSAHYKAGNYQQALDAFKQSDSSDALYNQGNALAKLEQYDDAISAYKKALEKNPNLTDAQDNIDKIEAMKEKQEQQQKQQSDKDQNKEQEKDKNKDQQKGDQSDQNQSQQDKSQDSSKEDQKGEPKNGENNDQTNKDKSEQDKQQEQSQSEQEKQKAKDEAEQKRKEQQAKKEQEQQKKDEQEAKKSPAQLSEAEEKVKETAQKHQQLLNQVTDDPYLLLRNKMQLEYQKRKQNNNSAGAKKKW